MRFPSIRKQQGYTVTVPQLSGGLNKAVPAHLIEDHQLSDVKNMWYKDGMLQTRPGLTLGDRATDVNNEIVVDSVVSFGDFALAYGFGESGDQPVMRFILLNADGTFRQPEISSYTWTHLEGTGVIPVAVLPAQVNVDAAEELSTYDVVTYISFSDGRVEVYGIDGQTMTYLEPYVPLVMIGGTPITYGTEALYYGMPIFQSDTLAANGTMLEPYNTLTDSWRCQYTTNGKSNAFVLPRRNLSRRGTYTVKCTGPNGVAHEIVLNSRDLANDQGEMHTVAIGVPTDAVYSDTKNIVSVSADLTAGVFYIRLTNDLNMDLSEIPNNVEFIYHAPTPATPDIEGWTIEDTAEEAECELCGMTFGTWFGGGSASLTNGTRLFASGSEKHPNLVRWSSLNNPLYFPENNYAYVGGNSSRVTAFGKQNELLVIFKENEIYCTQYVQGSVTADDVMNGSVMDTEAAIAVYPMVQLHPAIGCDCPDTVRLCNNRLVWLNSDGRVYGLFTAGQYSERNVRELSYVIERELREYSAEQLKAASAAEFEQHYLLMIGSEVYVMDYSSSGFAYYSSYSSDEKAQKAVQWYAWDFADTGLFHEYSSNRLLMEGRTALLFTQDVYGYPVTLTFEEGVGDVRHDRDRNTFSDNVRIPSSFTTKLYNFDRPDLKKAIKQLYLSVRDDEGSVIRVSYLTDWYEHEDAFTVTGEGEDGNGYIRTWRMTPNVNLAQAFGIRCDSDTGMAVQGILLKYKHQGVVR